MPFPSHGSQRLWRRPRRQPQQAPPLLLLLLRLGTAALWAGACILLAPAASASRAVEAEARPGIAAGGGSGGGRPPRGSAAVADPTCVGPDGTSVDWWLLLKYPGGEETAYLDSTTLLLLQEQRASTDRRRRQEPSPDATAAELLPLQLLPQGAAASGGRRVRVRSPFFGSDVADQREGKPQGGRRGVGGWRGPSGLRSGLRSGSSLDDFPAAGGAEGSQGGAWGGAGGAGASGADSCFWRPGGSVNDPAGPLRASLAAAGAAAAAVAQAVAVAATAALNCGFLRQGNAGGGCADGDGGVDGGGRKARQGQKQGGSSSSGNTTSANMARGGGGGSGGGGARGGPLGFAFYNDADPEGGEHWGFGHAKGVLLFGASGGVWITHSFPSYPGRPPRPGGRTGAAGEGDPVAPTVGIEFRSQGSGGANGRGDDGDGVGGASAVEDAARGDHTAGEGDPWDVVRHAQTVYGQHALCLTLPREGLSAVAESLLVARAYVYEHVMPYELVDVYGAVQALIDASADGRLPQDETEGATSATADAGSDKSSRSGGRGTGDGVKSGVGGRDDDGDSSSAPLRSSCLLRTVFGVRGEIGSSVRGLSASSRSSSASPRSSLPSSLHRLGLPLPRRQPPSAPRRLKPPLQPPVQQPKPEPPSQQNTSQRVFLTRAGGSWLHVTKSPNYMVPYHEQVLEPLLRSPMAWETWRLGTSYPSECPPNTTYGSFNVRRVRVPYCRGDIGGSVEARGGGGAADWDSLKDHSKWGISCMTEEASCRTGTTQDVEKSTATSAAANTAAAAGPATPAATHVCFGDLNRQPSQRSRGGGYVCTSNPLLWAAFRQIVTELEPCLVDVGPGEASLGFRVSADGS